MFTGYQEEKDGSGLRSLILYRFTLCNKVILTTEGACMGPFVTPMNSDAQQFMRILTAPCTKGRLTARNPTMILANLHTIEGFCDLAENQLGQHSLKGNKWPGTVLERIKKLGEGYAWTGPEHRVPPRIRDPCSARLTLSTSTAPYPQKMGRRPRTSGPNRSTYVDVKPTKIAELKGKPFKCIVASTNWGKGKNAGRMSSNLCAIAKDDDCEEFVTCIKFPYNGRPQQELIADAGQMSSYPCAVAQDDDRKRFVTCIKVIQAREREAERGGA
ncbi:hypothetical protein LA080_007777 [Diaporthe eres]|nr:hypothetical protein LA080_007777 [Diaporthe eres]